MTATKILRSRLRAAADALAADPSNPALQRAYDRALAEWRERESWLCYSPAT